MMPDPWTGVEDRVEDKQSKTKREQWDALCERWIDLNDARKRLAGVESEMARLAGKDVTVTMPDETTRLTRFPREGNGEPYLVKPRERAAAKFDE